MKRASECVSIDIVEGNASLAISFIGKVDPAISLYRTGLNDIDEIIDGQSLSHALNTRYIFYKMNSKQKN